MRLHFIRTILAIACLAIVAPHFLSRIPSLQGEVSPATAWGGKVEHCAIAVGMIGGALLSLFANPIVGPVAIGVMTAGLIWLTTCE